MADEKIDINVLGNLKITSARNKESIAQLITITGLNEEMVTSYLNEAHGSSLVRNVFENNWPSSLEEKLSKPWQKFLTKFNEIEIVKISQWKEVHLLAYFCKRYESLYGKKFALSFKGAPSKCNEIYIIKQMIFMLNSINMKTLRMYIDWVFDNKIIPSNLKIRSIGILLTPGFGNEYNLYAEAKSKIVKTTELPVEYKQIANTLQLQVSTYGDLAFIKLALEASPNSESRAPYKVLFNNLMAIGFEPSVLNNLV